MSCVMSSSGVPVASSWARAPMAANRQNAAPQAMRAIVFMFGLLILRQFVATFDRDPLCHVMHVFLPVLQRFDPLGEHGWQVLLGRALLVRIFRVAIQPYLEHADDLQFGDDPVELALPIGRVARLR